MSVLTQTRPWPPPGAGGLVATSALAPFARAGVAAAVVAPAEVLGLNKSPRLNLPGDAEATGVAAAVAAPFARVRFPLGEAAGDAEPAEFAAVVASACLRVRFALGEAAGDAAGEGDAAVLPDDAVLVALCVRCFVGD